MSTNAVHITLNEYLATYVATKSSMHAHTCCAFSDEILKVAWVGLW